MDDNRRNDDRVTIDGSEGEGGGQILRNSISYATILGRNIHLHKIRGKRSKPGLRAQHMTGLQICAELAGGILTNCSVGSMEVNYRPSNKRMKPDSDETDTDTDTDTDPQIFTGNTKTAGSICLILQAALPCAIFRSNSTKLILKGGTNASMAPQYDYWEKVFLPMVQTNLNIFPSHTISPNLISRGFFPKGGGEVHVNVKPLGKRTLSSFTLTERGDVTAIRIRSFVAGNLPLHLAETMAKTATKLLNTAFPKITPETDIILEKNSVGTGIGILIVAETSQGCLLAGSALGEKRKRAEEVSKIATKELIHTLQDGGCVDEWLQDQLILYMALAEGTSKLLTGSLTLHTQTAIWIAQQVCGAKVSVTKISDGKPLPEIESGAYGKAERIAGKHLIEVEGVGHVGP